MPQDAKRLDRIEEKIDTLSAAMIAFARAEEKLINLEQRHVAQYERMNKFSEKLDKIDAQMTTNALTISTQSFFELRVVSTIRSGFFVSSKGLDGENPIRFFISHNMRFSYIQINFTRRFAILGNLITFSI